VTPGFLNGAEWYYNGTYNATIRHLHDNIGSLKKLDLATCNRTYSDELTTANRNLLVVIDPQPGTYNASNSLVEVTDTDWNGCRQPVTCPAYVLLSLPETQYCLSEAVDEQCKLFFNLPLTIAVIACNFLKLISMILVARISRAPTLVTIGDAVASFLDEPDTTTAGMCMLGKAQIRKRWRREGPVAPAMWTRERKCWYQAASVARWSVCIAL
jgi:hypothetical protein